MIILCHQDIIHDKNTIIKAKVLIVLFEKLVPFVPTLKEKIDSFNNMITYTGKLY